ncbi:MULTISPECIES: hypothetical protein [unclassified Paraflavitalea]|uniref:hypothetical protein n=1 Tax=unclassified Paraflavitalea TaxID=2798305 RepID=UPI003D337119
MQEPNRYLWDDTEEVAELFELDLQPNLLASFFEAETSIHHFFCELPGYTGMQVLLLSESKVMLLLRWSNCDLFDQNLPTILNASPIGYWLKQACSFSHRPTLLKKFSNSK